MRRGLIQFLLLITLVHTASADSVIPQELACVNQPEVIVKPLSDTDYSEICSAAGQAIAFLKRYSLTPRRDIHIELVEERINSHGYIAYGSYDSRSDRIMLMSYAAILSGPEPAMMYGEPFDKVHYAGAIAHEVAHAVVQHNLKTKLLGTSPQEYLAHATQLAVMPEERRAAVIRAMDIEAWESGDAISDVYMAIEPGKFAVKSYKHLLAMTDPSPFIQILLNAKWFYVYVP